MRVISGTARGTKLNSLNGLATRPTLDRVKESLFNIIQNKIAFATVLDLFAGSGAIGIEALSRGAKTAYFCDNSYDAIDIINQNIEKTKTKDKAIVIKNEYDKCIQLLKNEKFDIIFLDPPYKTKYAIEAIKLITQYNVLQKDGIVIVETNDEKKEKEFFENENIVIYDKRKYGKVILFFLQLKGVNE